MNSYLKDRIENLHQSSLDFLGDSDVVYADFFEQLESVFFYRFLDGIYQMCIITPMPEKEFDHFNGWYSHLPINIYAERIEL